MNDFRHLLNLLFCVASLTLCAQSADSIRAVQYLQKSKALEASYQYEEAVDWYKKTIAIQKKVFGSISIEVGKAHNNLGICLDALADYDSAIQNYQEALHIKLQVAGDEANTTAISYLNLGVCYRHKNYINKALENYNKALKIRLALYGGDHLKIANIYENIAICYEMKGDYDRAITYYEKSLPIQLEHLDKFDREIGHSYNNIAGCLSAQNKIKEALAYYYKALEVQKNQDLNILDPSSGDVYNNLGTCYKRDNQLDKSLEMLYKSLAIKEKVLPKNHRKIGTSYLEIGSCYMKREEYNQALLYYNKFLDLILAKPSPSSIDLSEAYIKLANAHCELKNYEQALVFQNKAWEAFYADISTSNKKGVTQQQFNSQNEKALNNPLKYYNILSGKAQILWEIYKHTKKQSYLFPALLSFRQTINFLDQLRFSYTENQSKQLLVENVYEDYESAIAVCYELYQKNENPRFAEEAFIFAEKSKSVLLLESVNVTTAENFSGIPDSLLEQEKELKADIARIEQEKFLALQESKGSHQAKIIAFNKELFDLKQAQSSLINQFETNYKKYYDLKYDASTSSIESVQNLLSPEQTMVAYFLGDSSLFAFVIAADEVQFLTLEKDRPIKDAVQDVLVGLYNYQLNKKLNQRYINAAHQLYQQLWEQVVPASAKEIIIIPSGELGVLPFEVLLKTIPATPKYYSTYDYLIKDQQISYNYSATLFEKLSAASVEKEHNLLAFAPSFISSNNIALAGQGQRAFDRLRYNKEEVKNLKRILAVEEKIFVEDAATKDNFLKHASAYSLIHLATHGSVNNEFEDYSYLAFADHANEHTFDNQLFVKDLYNLSLQADMVVLSACETGVGELKKGEGIVSLARGFFYAGAKSIVTTLWKVSDKSSAKIVKSFYANLNQQMPKDAALRQAKLDYLNDSPNKLAHPFYWAAYIPVGNMNALSLQPSYFYWYLGLSLLSFCILVILYLLLKHLF